MLIGYLRGGADGEDVLAAHRRALAEAGCERVVEDLAAGRRREQPELHRVLDALQAGDVVVVPALACLGRSLPEVVQRMQQVAAAGAGLRSLKEALDTTTPEGQAAAGMIGSLAGLGHGKRGGRTVAQVAVARAAGRKPGRRPKLTGKERAAVVEAVLSGRSTAAGMARHHEVSEATISRVLAAHRAQAGAPDESRPAGLDGAQDSRIAGALPAAALDERLAIVGTSGSGKTYAAKGLVERLLEQGARVCVVDPLGVWWGLRAGPDGGASPLPCPVVVFGGRYGDVPLDEHMGGALGHLIGTHQVACVVDVSDLGGAAARRGFMTAFTEALYAANREPLHLVLDEADLWAPQRAQPDGYDLLQRVEEIVRRGRVRGFVPWLITQRPAVLHKDVLSAGRRAGVHEAHLQPGPGGHRPLDRGPGGPGGGPAHPGRPAPTGARRGLGVGTFGWRLGKGGFPEDTHAGQLGHAAAGGESGHATHTSGNRLERPRVGTCQRTRLCRACGFHPGWRQPAIKPGAPAQAA